MGNSQMKNPEKAPQAGRPPKGTLPKALIGKKLKVLQGERKNAFMEGLLGVSRSQYGGILNGERNMSSAGLAALHRETGVDLNWLLDDDKPAGEYGDPYPRAERAEVGDRGPPSNEPGKVIIDAPTVAEQRERIAELERKNEALQDALVEMSRELADARRAAETARGLHEDNGAAGA